MNVCLSHFCNSSGFANIPAVYIHQMFGFDFWQNGGLTNSHALIIIIFKPVIKISNEDHTTSREPLTVEMRQPCPREWTYEGGRKLLKRVATDVIRTRYPSGLYGMYKN